MTATARLFKNGRSQAVRLPAEFRFEGTEVNIRRDPKTGEVILSPKPQRTGSWDKFFQAVDKLGLDEDFMKDRDQGEHEREDVF
jgi:antitoxin VapB